MDNKIVLIILSLLLPPLAVFFKAGAGKHLIINIILCFLMFFPAIVHSLWVCFKDG
ncbi:YqaE/Pmp3 family membrane protein [Motilimonas pumila]|uniref:YqaE/Pmp3 family membrane protein n=1 Tax=Motilimonas pumila TaxID=2303987 RepID=A0A418YGD5_9GAMM|nr:YqaE/Pmp3 family membrane protein [Motilimonas pumila]RJG48694.1 YqaE/Pmp3 family membrane protein [Motilimonas pumila]